MKRAAVLLFWLMLCCAAAGGCTTYHTLQKCGVGGCPGDKQITADVEQLFTLHAALEAPNELHVQTMNSVVYLTGIVNSPREQQLASLVAREAPGVSGVVNSIGLYNGR